MSLQEIWITIPLTEGPLLFKHLIYVSFPSISDDKNKALPRKQSDDNILQITGSNVSEILRK